MTVADFCMLVEIWICYLINEVMGIHELKLSCFIGCLNEIYIYIDICTQAQKCTLMGWCRDVTRFNCHSVMAH